MTGSPYSLMAAADALAIARGQLYAVAGGNIDSGDVRAARLSTRQRIKYFRTHAFREWVAAENAAGRQVFWLKDVDMTQSAGDAFTFFFKWKADNDAFTKPQLAAINQYLIKREFTGRSLGKKAPAKVLDLWHQHEQGGPGLSLLDFWSGAYWPSQTGLTRDEKREQVEAFLPSFKGRVYPGVPEENRLLEKIGVHVVIVSYGDQELASGLATMLGVKPENAVGTRLLYRKNGRSDGSRHSYETFDKDWLSRPQAGKALSFHFWLHHNREKWGWKHLDHRKVVIAGRDGDSASSDGGMMILMSPPALGNFMVDTPGQPKRIAKFQVVAAKYGWTPGQFFTLVQKPSLLGDVP